MDMREFEILVETAHGTQVDKAGKPYYGHCTRVRDNAAGILASLPDGLVGEDEAEAILMAALGHDTIEDTHVTKEFLLEKGVPAEAVAMIRAVSNNDGFVGSYDEKMEKIASGGHLGTIVVKLADNKDNRDPVRLAQMPEEKASRFAAKYASARIVLEAGLEKAVARRVEEAEAPGFRT